MRRPVKFLTVISALLIAGSTFALPARISPCPSINAIKGMTMAEEVSMNVFLAFQISQYSGDTRWAFMMGPFENSSKEALDTANKLLSTMSAEGIPIEAQGIKYCSYETGTEIKAVAIEDDTMQPVAKIKQLLKNMR